MPPACGLGFSERIFWSLEGVTAREGVPFPHLRAEFDETTKAIYPEVNLDGQKKSTLIVTRNLPLSAADQGTKKLYLEDYATTTSQARVLVIEDLGEGTYRFILDQTCFYPGGGGQDFDLGTINWELGKLTITEVSKDKAGVIYHDGVLEGEVPVAQSDVVCHVDTDRRFLNSKLHCAGHLIDRAVELAGKNWKAGRGAHYPHMSFVEYDGDYDPSEAETLARNIESHLASIIEKGGVIGVKRVPSSEAGQYSDYLPQAVLSQYQEVHIAMYPDNFNVCCGGTHLRDVSELGKVAITKVKKKDGHIRVSYALAE